MSAAAEGANSSVFSSDEFPFTCQNALPPTTSTTTGCKSGSTQYGCWAVFPLFWPPLPNSWPEMEQKQDLKASPIQIDMIKAWKNKIA